MNVRGDLGAILIDLLVLSGLILLNGLFALAEIAVVSARKARLKLRADQGEENARRALALAQDPSDFLSTVQVGITLVGVLAGAIGTATIAAKLSEILSTIAFLAPYRNLVSVGVVVVVITYLSLIFGELVPKRVALTDPERTAMRVAAPMQWLAKAASPVVWLLSTSTDWVLRLIGVQPAGGPPVTEEEIKVMLQQGTLAGVFAEAEQELVAGVFRLGDRRVDTLITPRTEIAWLDPDDPPEVTLSKLTESQHSWFPVARQNLDNLLGVVQAKDLLNGCLQEAGGGLGRLDLKAALIEPIIVLENMPALKVLERFKDSRIHIALVIDEFGGVQGLVTSHDLLEAIVGEIVVTGEPDESEVIQREDGSWLVDGMLPVDEFKERFGIQNLPEEQVAQFQTMSGFIMSYLGRIPQTSDHFEWGGYHYEVVDMDGFRVDKILVLPVPQDDQQAGNQTGI